MPTIWKPEFFGGGGDSGITNHTELEGLTSGDSGHTQFTINAGRSGGQNIRGGTQITDHLTLRSNNKTNLGIVIQETGEPLADSEYTVTDAKSLTHKKYVDDSISNINHDDTNNISLVSSGVTYGHINDQAQTIVGLKTFSSGTDTTNSKIDSLLFDISATPITGVTGLMQWNTTDGTADLGMPNDVTMQIGQEMFVKVINKTGSTITNGSAVYFDGRLGNRPKIALAKGDAHSTSCVVGLTTQDIEDDDEGYVTTVGYVRQIKTDYDGWTAGAKLYVSSSVAGELTITEPTVPHHSDLVGTVGIVGSAGIGSIFVSIERHKGLEDLSDVDGTPLTASGQFPVWNQTAGYFDFDKNINDYELAADVTAIETATKEPTGFTNNQNITVSYNSTTKKVTLTGTFKAYWRGTEITALVSGWESAAIPGTPAAPYHLYYNGTAFVWSTDAWSFDMLQICYVYYTAGGAFVFAQRECHGFMGHHTHEDLHRNIGTYLVSGGDLSTSSYVIGSTVAAERRPDTSITYIDDEDLETILPAKTDKLYNLITLTGEAVSTFALDQADIVPLNVDAPYYNSYSAPNWGQTPMSANQYMCLWKIAIPVTSDAASQKYRYAWIQGQSQGNLASQQALSPANLNLGTLRNFAPEFVFIDKVIIRFTAGNWLITQVDKLTGNKSNFVSTTGGYLSIVTTDTSLTGTGTASSPLGINGILIASREYADNSAALAGGLVAGQFYRTVDTVKVVHD